MFAEYIAFLSRRLLSELPDKGWKLESIDSLLKRSHMTVTMLSASCLRQLSFL